DGTLIGKYRKTHLFACSPVYEHHCLSPGDSYEIMEIGGLKFGLLICYDLRFPELARSLALKGAQVLVLVSAWPRSRIEHWRILCAARAIENQLYMVAANRVGQDGEMVFGGSSCLVDPYGIVIGSANDSGEALLVGEIDEEKIASVRKKMPVFEHRREDIY
ncbi:MAG: carbon-nitrogen family hydrolase, partial [Deltaproteobacteria bacterium]|nr:carbon-nitrogen family hydrolase [Deltaproteobacteria bacterium]